MQIEQLTVGEGARWRGIRLRALSEAPHAFGTTYDEALQWTDPHWEAQIAQFATFVAVVDGRDVGVARGATHHGSDARELISMWVDPAARRQRVAARLIDRVAAWAAAEGASRLVLDVIADNTPALALYRGAGFTEFDGHALGSPALGEVRLMRLLMLSNWS